MLRIKITLGFLVEQLGKRWYYLLIKGGWRENQV